MSSEESNTDAPSPSGPSRASRGNKVERPPTAFALAPINLSDPSLGLPKTNNFGDNDFSETASGNEVQDSNDNEDDTNQELEETESVPEEPEEPKNEEPKKEENSAAPTRSTTAHARPPTTFVTGPIKPNANPSVRSGSPGGPRRAAPQSRGRPGTTFVSAPRPNVNPSLTAPNKNAELIKQEKIEAAKSSQNLRVNTNELLQYASAEEIWAKSSAVATFRAKIDNIYVLEQLFVCLVEPKKCTLFSNLSSGLGDARIQELHNKMKCVSTQLLLQIDKPAIFEKIFRHNLLDHLYLELMTSPAPINDLSAHYMREVMGNLIKYQKAALLNYLSANAPGKSQSRASLMFNHFYAENISILFDEVVALEESYTQQQNSKNPGAARGGPPARGGLPARGKSPMGSPRGAPRGRGGPGRGGPPRGRGGPPRGRGGPPRGRGGPPRGRGGPARGRGGPSYRFTKTFDLESELRKQFFGGSEKSPDSMVYARGQQRSINTVHVYQGLLFRGWDSTTISGLLRNIGDVVDTTVEGDWLGIEVIECRMKALIALLKYINKHWNPNTPKGKSVKEAADVLIKDKICKGTILNALKSPPTCTVLTPLKIYKKNVTVGSLRVQLIHFFSFIMLVRFLDVYAQDIISSGIVKTILDLFVAYPHNYFLHETVSKTMIMNIMKCKSDALFTHLFVDCKLLELIMDNFQPISKQRTKDPLSYVSYNGHLVFLANTIKDGNYLNRANIQSKLNMSKWNSFVSDELRTINSAM